MLEAARERFRPILMTTFAALLGAMPLAIASGPGSELRRPLGIAIIGGLLVSQVLTLYTTPIIYVLLDKMHRRLWGSAATAPPPNTPLPPSDMTRSVNSVALGNHRVYAAVQQRRVVLCARAAGQKNVCQSLTLIRAGPEPKVYKDAGGASMRDPLRALRGTADRVS